MSYQPLNQHKISKRTGKNTVAIVGFSPDSRHLAPYDDEDTEIWSLNEAGIQPWMKRWDRWFQLHPRKNFTDPNNRNDPNHFAWLQAQTKPIYMQKQYQVVPASVKYPIKEVKKLYGSYYTSSVAYMLALAMLEGFERIELYGVSMGNQTEYNYQRANGEYLIGLARGLGHEVYLPDESPLCKGKMYAYETMEIAFGQELEYKRNNLENLHKVAEMETLKLVGKIVELNDICEMYPDNQELAERRENLSREVEKAKADTNFLQGQVDGLNVVIKMYDTHIEKSGVGHEQESESEAS